MTVGLTVEVQGTWLENFGAELMLRTVTARLAERLGGIEVALDPRWGDHRRRCMVGAWALLPPRCPGWALAAATATTVARIGGKPARALLDGYGVVVPGDCRALLDLSGFAFSDQWGVAKARQRADRAAWYAGRGRPVVAFPQAVGPFRDPQVATQFDRFVDAADLVYLRDPESMDMARSVVRATKKLRLAPDVTFDSPVAFGSTTVKHEVAIVPNGRLVDRGSWDRGNYLALLEAVVSWARMRGLTPIVLVHSLESDDHDLAAELGRQCGVEVVTPIDALEAKSRLAAVRLVVSSRFHALMAALSQGVPVIAAGWSHKYDALLSRFELEASVLRPGGAPADVGRLGDELLGSGRIRARIAELAEQDRSSVRAVWDEVAPLLR